MTRLTKLTIKEILPHLDKIICPCLTTCPALQGTTRLVKYLDNLGFKTNRNTLKWVINRLYESGIDYNTKYDFIPGKSLQALYSSKLVTDVCKVYRAFKLKRTAFESIING